MHWANQKQSFRTQRVLSQIQDDRRIFLDPSGLMWKSKTLTFLFLDDYKHHFVNAHSISGEPLLQGNNPVPFFPREILDHEEEMVSLAPPEIPDPLAHLAHQGSEE